MIYGVGTDVVEIGRIAAALKRYGERFAQRVLCLSELERFHKHRLPANYLAKRFAAKEAFSKALGTGIKAPANWHGVWVRNLASGQPVLEFSEALDALLKKRGITSAHVSLSDEKGLAFATVILECEK
ncbi:MAG: holo-ACP synthase [Betaproteobacteria bacterium]|nr:MAG: holo-ACP synthase [Betaproteobacteria bacterium]